MVASMVADVLATARSAPEVPFELGATDEHARAVLVAAQPAARAEVVDPLPAASEELRGLVDVEVLARRCRREPLEYERGRALGDRLDDGLRQCDPELAQFRRRFGFGSAGGRT